MTMIYPSFSFGLNLKSNKVYDVSYGTCGWFLWTIYERDTNSLPIFKHHDNAEYHFY